MSLKRPRLPKLTLSIDVDEQEAELDRRVAQFSKDMAAVDRECLSQHLVDDVFVIKPVGRGASGMVHLACHAPTLRLLALKSVSVEDDVHEAAVMQELHAEHSQLVPLTSEGAPAWLFHHRRHIGDVHPCPQIVSFYGSYADRESRRVWMALEYMDAGSLDRYCGCGVEERVLLHVARETLRGLAHMEECGVVHRDVKPANILLSHAGCVKLGDLGLARALALQSSCACGPATATATAPPYDINTSVGVGGVTLDRSSTDCHSEHVAWGGAGRAGQGGGALLTAQGGTVAYLSPERVRGEPYDCRADVWSLGVSLIEFSTGECPINRAHGFLGVAEQLQNPEPMARLTSYSGVTAALVAAMVEKDPERRPRASVLLGHEALRALPTASKEEAAAAAAAHDELPSLTWRVGRRAHVAKIERPDSLMRQWALLLGASNSMQQREWTAKLDLGSETLLHEVTRAFAVHCRQKKQRKQQHGEQHDKVGEATIFSAAAAPAADVKTQPPEKRAHKLWGVAARGLLAHSPRSTVEEHAQRRRSTATDVAMVFDKDWKAVKQLALDIRLPPQQVEAALQAATDAVARHDDESEQ
eukprot:g2825.t1